MNNSEYIKEWNGRKFIPCVIGDFRDGFQLFAPINMRDGEYSRIMYVEENTIGNDYYNVFPNWCCEVNDSWCVFPKYFEEMIWKHLLRTNSKPISRCNQSKPIIFALYDEKEFGRYIDAKKENAVRHREVVGTDTIAFCDLL